jgi:hypothetical protein
VVEKHSKRQEWQRQSVDSDQMASMADAAVQRDLEQHRHILARREKEEGVHTPVVLLEGRLVAGPGQWHAFEGGAPQASQIIGSLSPLREPGETVYKGDRHRHLPSLVGSGKESGERDRTRKDRVACSSLTMQRRGKAAAAAADAAGVAAAAAKTAAAAAAVAPAASAATAAPPAAPDGPVADPLGKAVLVSPRAVVILEFDAGCGWEFRYVARQERE